MSPAQGEIWWAESPDMRRPVLLITRTVAIPALNRILVAPITRSVRGIPTEIPLGPEQGLPEPCAASFDNVQPMGRGFLVSKLGRLSPDQTHEICRAFEAVADC